MFLWTYQTIQPGQNCSPCCPIVGKLMQIFASVSFSCRQELMWSSPALAHPPQAPAGIEFGFLSAMLTSTDCWSCCCLSIIVTRYCFCHSDTNVNCLIVVVEEKSIVSISKFICSMSLPVLLEWYFYCTFLNNWQ